MSSTPPPFQPPGPPGPPGPSGPTPPPWQGGTSLQPELTPRRKSKLPLILGVLVVAAVIAVVALLALGGGDSASTSPNAKGAHEGLRTALDDSSFDDSGNDTLRDCPLGDIDDLYAAVDAVIEIDSSVANGKVAQSAREQGDLPGFVSCERYAEDESLVDTGPTDIFFQAVLDPPRDYRGYIVDFAGDATDTHFDPSVAYRGGTVEMFCSVAKDDSGFTGCDADWVDTKNKIALNVFLGGADATSEDAFAALKAVLPKMADNLAKVADSGR